jgi:hypothetical protein
MKTSNIIIIAFATFIIGGMLFLFTDAKRHKEVPKIETSFKEFALPSFSVVVAEKGADVHIDQSDSTIVKIEYLKDKKTPSKIYEVVNDTLHIYGGLRTFVKCKKITAIIGNKPFWVGVNNFTPDSMTIRMNGGQLIYNRNRSDKSKRFNQKIFNLRIIANDSAHVVIDDAKIHNLSVKSDNSKIINNCYVNSVNTTLSNKSEFISLDKIRNLVVEKDSTCQVRITNQNVY